MKARANVSTPVGKTDRERDETNTENFLQKRKPGSRVVKALSVSYWFLIVINKRGRSLTKVLLGGLEMCPTFIY